MAKRKAKSISKIKPTAKEKQVGKVHRFIATDKGVYPFSILKEHQQNVIESRQLPEDDLSWMHEHGLVPVPFNVNNLLWLQDNCTFFDACVRQIATDVAGDWSLVPTEEGTENKEQKKEIMQLFEDPNNKDETLQDIVRKCVVDRGVIGWWSIEVNRGNDRKVNGLFHVPAHTVRVHRKRQKYCQVRDTRKRWFKRFGAKIEVHADTGQDYKTKRGKFNANELIFQGEYYALNTYYGRPNILPAIGSVFGIIGVRNYNLAFFENYGIPAALVLMEGEWEEGSAKQISDFIDNEIKGTDNQHKTVVLEMPPTCKITWQPIVVEVKEGHFTIYFKSLRDEILTAHKMPPYRIGIAEVGSLGGSTAPTADKIYVQAIVEPIQEELARMITTKIIWEGLEAEAYKFQFNKIDMRDWAALVDRWVKLFGMAVVTPGWIAQQIGLDTKKMEHADEYFISSSYAPVSEAGLRVPKMDDAEIERKVKAMLEAAKKKEAGSV